MENFFFAFFEKKNFLLTTTVEKNDEEQAKMFCIGFTLYSPIYLGTHCLIGNNVNKMSQHFLFVTNFAKEMCYDTTISTGEYMCVGSTRG